MDPMSDASSREKQRGREVVPHGLRMANNLLTATQTGIVGEFGLYLGTFGEEDAELLPYGNSPEWSPDGSEIAYSISHQFGSRLTFMDVRTRKLEQPLPDKALQWQSNPSWSAAGDRLAISGNRHPLPIILDRDLHNAWADKYTVFVVNRDGTGLQQLVEEDGPAARIFCVIAGRFGGTLYTGD